MDIYQGISLGILVLIGAETTYLAIKQPSTIKRKGGVATLIDTSVLIDGRIVSVAKAGFAGGTLIVPRSVIAELQYMADNADHDKRTRARYGLDVIQELQQMKDVTVEVLQDGTTRDVDSQLVTLAKQYNAQLCTIDYNLNKVAQVEGITVLNVNELAQALRATHLPGETYELQLVQKGSDSHQGVGYLEDGTMVVVENSSAMIGKEVVVEFTRVLQTQAGRMMFAKRVDDAQPRPPQQGFKSQPVTQKNPKQGKKPPRQSPANKKQHQPPQPQVQPMQPPTTIQAKAAPQQPRYTSRPKNRTTPEDSLIALANKQKQ